MIGPLNSFTPFAGLTQRGGGGGSAAPRAALMLHVGQSLNAARGGTIVQALSSASVQAFMAVGGAHLSAFDFWSGGAGTGTQQASNGADWATAATFEEGGEGQSPMAGVTNTISGYETVLLHSMAIGATDLKTLHERFFHVAAGIERGVELLVAEGYERTQIDVLVSIKHGEHDAVLNTSQATYEALFADYIERIRIAARQAVQRPDYMAPLHMTPPVQTAQAEANRVILRALTTLADTVPEMYVGQVGAFPIESDRTHPTPRGYVFMGEQVGYQLSPPAQGLRCTGVTLAGSTFVASFNKPVVRDASLGLGTGLNAANARDGLEWWDGSAYVAITDLVYSGSTVTGTLASAPAGGELRIACQETTNVATVDLTLHVGCAIRSTDAARPGVFDPEYTHFDWCTSQIVEAA